MRRIRYTYARSSGLGVLRMPWSSGRGPVEARFGGFDPVAGGARRRSDRRAPEGEGVSAAGGLMLRFEMYFPNETKWRPFLSAEHGALCRQAGLDPVRHYFDVPESFKRIGAGSATYLGREVSGYIMRAGEDRPVGKVSIAREGERFREHDPRDRSEFEGLG